METPRDRADAAGPFSFTLQALIRASRSVGMIGLGIMGSAMAANLSRAKYRVIGYDVLEARRRALRRAGGQAANDCGDVARQAGVVICSLPSSEALRQIAGELAAAGASEARRDRNQHAADRRQGGRAAARWRPAAPRCSIAR